MSRGSGKIQTAIEALLDANPDNAFTVEDLCIHIYRCPVSKSQRVALLRAIKGVIGRRHYKTELSQMPGQTVIIYNPLSPMSIAMAAGKGSPDIQYQSKAPGAATIRESFIQSLYAPGGIRHAELAEGGSFWARAEEGRAREQGDIARADTLRAKRQHETDTLLAKIRESRGH